MSLLRLREVNTGAYNNPLSIGTSSRKLWNQEYLTLTFPKSSRPGRKKRSRPSELQITVPGYDKRKLEEVNKPAQIRIRNFLRKNFQRPSNYFIVRRQAPFRYTCTPKKTDSKKLKDDNDGITFKKYSKKNSSLYETTPESKKMGNNIKPKRGDKSDRIPSKLSQENEPAKKSKHESETNPESKDSKAVLMKHSKISQRDLVNSKKTDIESICTKKNSMCSKINSDAKSEACLKNTSNMDSMIHLKVSGDESMEFDMWLNNCSQNNSKKPLRKEAKKSSDAESSDSKDAKKEKEGKKQGSKKKNPKKGTESTDAESVDPKDTKRSSKKAKKDTKKIDQKKDARDTESTDAEYESELESKKGKKDPKNNKKGSKKDDKKKDAKKDTVSTDADLESKRTSKKAEKDKKTDKRGSKKGDKKMSAMKYEDSSETESEWASKKHKKGSKKTKRDSKKDAREQDAKNLESTTDAEYIEYSKKEPEKPRVSKSSDAESEESVDKFRAKKKGIHESDATFTDSKKEALELKRDLKTSFRKTTFEGKGRKTVTSRVPPSRESPLLSPCEPLPLSPKIKHVCQCKMHPPPTKPRYAPLPEAKWIQKLL